MEFYFVRWFEGFGGGDWVGEGFVGVGMVRWMDGGLGKGGLWGRAGFIRPFYDYVYPKKKLSFIMAIGFIVLS